MALPDPPQPCTLPAKLPATLKGVLSVIPPRSPQSVQLLLDSMAYNTDAEPRTPIGSLTKRRVNCFDGALLAAALLASSKKQLGVKKVSLVQLTAIADDDHLLCVFEGDDGLLGAVAKSNFAGLRYRDPVYRTVRELAMSYYPSYFNLEGRKTLVGYTVQIPFERVIAAVGTADTCCWEDHPCLVDCAVDLLCKARRYYLIPKKLLTTSGNRKGLGPVDCRTFRSGTLGVDVEGCHGATKKRKRGSSDEKK